LVTPTSPEIPAAFTPPGFSFVIPAAPEAPLAPGIPGFPTVPGFSSFGALFGPPAIPAPP
jgi:hypothetical protein